MIDQEPIETVIAQHPSDVTGRPAYPGLQLVIALTGKLCERLNYLPNGEAAPLDESDSLFADGWPKGGAEDLEDVPDPDPEPACDENGEADDDEPAPPAPVFGFAGLAAAPPAEPLLSPGL